MRYAIVRDEIIENLVEWDGGDAWAPPGGTQAHACPDGTVAIGWRWNGGAPEDPAPPPVLPVAAPPLTRLQFKLELLERGLLDAAESAVAGLDAASRLVWTELAWFEVDHPLVCQIAAAIGLDEAARRALFETAGARTS